MGVPPSESQRPGHCNPPAACLFALKGLWLTVLLYTLFAALSVLGWRTWARLERQGG